MLWKKPKPKDGPEAVGQETPSSSNKQEENAKVPVSNYWRILSFGNRTEHGLLVLATLAAAGSGAALPLMNVVFGGLVGNFNDYTDANVFLSRESFQNTTNRYALYFVYLFIGKFVLTYIGMFCFRVAGLRISAALRLKYLRALFAQPIRKLDLVSAGTIATTITSSADTIQMSISDRLSVFFQSVALVIAAYAIAFTYSWALTLVVSSAILFVMIAIALFLPHLLKAMQIVTKADEKHATVASEALSSIRTVAALGAEEKMIQKHARWVMESYAGNLALAKWLAAQIAPFMFATYTSYSLAFWYGLKLFRKGHINSITNVIVVFFSVLLVTTVIGRIATPIMHIGQAISASTTFFETIDGDAVKTDGIRSPDVSAYQDITFKDVSFAYPSRSDVLILDKCNMTFEKGRTTAIVGPSGSGKSTIVALLERWYSLRHDRDVDSPELMKTMVKSIIQGEEDKSHRMNVRGRPSSSLSDKVSGSIRVGSHDIDECDLVWWRSQIGLVQQEPFLFNDTIEKNVGYGLVGTCWEKTDDATRLGLIKEACIEAFADEFIQKLPKGYSTRVGEGGIKLSGGQRQRLAIARSIVRKPAILILDEATSAIDVRGEKIVQQALDRAARDRTTIVIAHRLSTIRKADRIIVLRHGQVIEQGRHDELLAMRDGLYTALVNAQKIEGRDSIPASAPDLANNKHINLDANAVVEISASQSSHLKREEFSAYKDKGFFRAVGGLVVQERSIWSYGSLALLAAAICGAAYALQSWFFAQLIKAFTYTGQRLVDAGNFWALMFFILAIAVTMAYVVLNFVSGRISASVGAVCRKAYFQDTLRMPISYFDEDENSSGTVMHRLSGDPKQIQDLLGPAGTLPLISIFNIIASVIISFYFGWKLSLVVFFAVTPVIIGASWLRMRYEVKFVEYNSAVFAGSSQFATEAIGAIRTVSSLTMERVVLNKYEHLLQDQIQKTTRKSSYALLVFALSDSIELCAMALAFWYGGRLLGSGEYDTIQFFVIYAAIVQGAQAVGSYLSISPNLANSNAAANRIINLRERAPPDALIKHESYKEKSELGCHIEFENVTFQYPSADRPLFTGLDLDIAAGQFVAFVGPSGCGKTSIISMLERFYDPQSGDIRIDGRSISDVHPRTYRQNIALVSQEPRLFSGTARDNLLLGVESDSITDAQIEQACRDAEIHDFLVSLPDGYNTELGLSTQTTLSGGQKQRLCLARALLRKPHLLLLDEATSSLDSQSERLVQSAIERLAGQRSMTVIAVAHRLATIQKADVIFVFGQRDTEGQSGSHIVERGTHVELQNRRGMYWSMCQAQALDR